MITTIEQLEAEVDKVLYLEDRGVVRVLCAAVIANRLPLDPVWLFLVSGSSTGKSELINFFGGLPFIYPISDITPNTFLSGKAKGEGDEPSLLYLMKNGIMSFKDFTTILSKKREAKGEILAQLREIFDGEYIKRTGTGKDLTWRGKVGAIAGATDAIYRHLDEFSAMGNRFVMYNMQQLDREGRHKASERVFDNMPHMTEYRSHLRKCFKEYVEHVISKASGKPAPMTKEFRREAIDIADFATMARTAVYTDYRTGRIEGAADPEGPMRVVAQQHGFMSAFVAMQGELTDFDHRIIYKVAWDSIPNVRRTALLLLAQYKDGTTTKAYGQHIGIPSDSAKKFLEQLAVLKLIDRKKGRPTLGDLWQIKEEYRDIINKLHGVEVKEGELPIIEDAPDEVSEEYASQEDAAEREWDRWAAH